MKINKPSPFQQGDLDGFCGLYVLMNIVQTLNGKMSKNEQDIAWRLLIQESERTVPLVEVAVDGMSYGNMRSVIKSYLSHWPSINFNVPLSRQKDATWTSMQSTLKLCLAEKGGLCLASMSGADEHWSLIRSISSDRLTLLDSGGRQYLSSALVRTPIENGSAPYVLFPNHLYHFYVSGEKL